MAKKKPNIALSSLAVGAPGLTEAWGKFLAEAGAICLDNQGHKSGVNLEVIGSYKKGVSLSWEEVTEQMKRAWGDLQEATEYGACCVAILLILKLTKYTVIERSIKGTGFDYWLGRNGSMLFQDKARLEVSGIKQGGANDIMKRGNEKREQTNRSDGTNLPAYIVIVEFSLPKSLVGKK